MQGDLYAGLATNKKWKSATQLVLHRSSTIWFKNKPCSIIRSLVTLLHPFSEMYDSFSIKQPGKLLKFAPIPDQYFEPDLQFAVWAVLSVLLKNKKYTDETI